MYPWSNLAAVAIDPIGVHPAGYRLWNRASPANVQLVTKLPTRDDVSIKERQPGVEHQVTVPIETLCPGENTSAIPMMLS